MRGRATSLARPGHRRGLSRVHGSWYCDTLHRHQYYPHQCPSSIIKHQQRLSWLRPLSRRLSVSVTLTCHITDISVWDVTLVTLGVMWQECVTTQGVGTTDGRSIGVTLVWVSPGLQCQGSVAWACLATGNHRSLAGAGARQSGRREGGVDTEQVWGEAEGGSQWLSVSLTTAQCHQCRCHYPSPLSSPCNTFCIWRPDPNLCEGSPRQAQYRCQLSWHPIPRNLSKVGSIQRLGLRCYRLCCMSDWHPHQIRIPAMISLTPQIRGMMKNMKQKSYLGKMLTRIDKPKSNS